MAYNNQMIATYIYSHLLIIFILQILENEIFKFEEQICDFEEDLGNESIPEDIRDSILAAIGKAKLLMSQKLMQFRGLCDKNIVSFFANLKVKIFFHLNSFNALFMVENSAKM